MTWAQNVEWLLSCLPAARGYLTPHTREIRVRAGRPMVLTGPEGVQVTRWIPDAQAVYLAAQALTGHSLHARQREAADGSLFLPGGHRLGLCGQMGPEGFETLSGFCLRIAGQWPGAADPFTLIVRERPVSLMVIGPPGSGKTTFLRDLCRQWSTDGVQAAIHDQRGELAALWGGAPQLDIGPMTDVLAGVPRSQGLYQLLRTVCPQVIFTDEVDREDMAAVCEAMLCGVKVCASAHGRGLAQVRQRFAQAAFDAYAVLDNGRMTALYDREGKEWA